MPSVTASYVLAVEIGINLALVVILKFLSITPPNYKTQREQGMAAPNIMTNYGDGSSWVLRQGFIVTED